MVGVASVLALAWAVLVWISGGTTIAVAGLRVSSTDPIRPLVAAALLAAIYVLTSGRQRVREDAALARRLATASRLAAAVLAAAIGVIAIAQSSYTASGADAYAYVTQADLLLAGTLTVPVPMANEVPWPAPLSTFVPFGYAAVAHESAIASAVGPGLPLLMALFKAIGGHAALFLVVPITAALLVWSTFAIGRALGSTSLGLGAAWLMATSPAFLTMVKEPMSDVPAAAFWALATWKLLDTSRLSTMLAGDAAAIAILIRPEPGTACCSPRCMGAAASAEDDVRDRLRTWRHSRSALCRPVWPSPGSTRRSSVHRSRLDMAQPSNSSRPRTCSPTSTGTARGSPRRRHRLVFAGLVALIVPRLVSGRHLAHGGYSRPWRWSCSRCTRSICPSMPGGFCVCCCRHGRRCASGLRR